MVRRLGVFLGFATFLSLQTVTGAILRNFQVAHPVPVPKDAKQCTVKVLERDFAFTFGEGEVVALAPPTDCGEPGTWAAITLNFTVTSNGTQFDRLAIFNLHNVEIWRSSTPEPTRDGIIWTYIKDVTQYLPLFAENGTFILQLDNLVDDRYTGIYSTVLHATYYASSKHYPSAKKADAIIPLSTLSNTTGNDASVPPVFSINVTLPRNAVQVYAELIITGNAQEEFWYFNAANEYLNSLPEGTTYGQGPFREARLLIDGHVAGIVFPYAPIYTGGFAPSMWRPIAAYGALDVPTYPIDVTPFIPLLNDGQPHSFSIDVLSAESDHTTNANWYVSGSLQVITDSSSEPTTGRMISYNVDPYASTSTTGHVATSGDVDITVDASHNIYIESELMSGSGIKAHVVWSQELRYSNFQSYHNDAVLQRVRQSSTGKVFSKHNGVPTIMDVFDYPLNVDFEYQSIDLRNWTVSIDHSYNRVLLPSSLRVKSTIKERQTTTGFYQLATGGNFGDGTNNNTLSYADVSRNTYWRKVNAASNNITLDIEGGSLAPSNTGAQGPSTATDGAGRRDEKSSAVARLPGGRISSSV